MDQSYEYDIPSHQYRHGDVYGGDENENTTLDNVPTTAANTTKPEQYILDNIIVGYAFGPKKMETMGLIMAEASKALSTFECAGTLSSMINNIEQQQKHYHPLTRQQQELFEDSSVATMTTGAASLLTGRGNGESNDNIEKDSVRTHFLSDNEDDTRSLSSTYTRSSFISQKSQQRGLGGSSNGVSGIQLTFLPDSSGVIHLVGTGSLGGSGGEGESITESSVTTSATNLASVRKHGASSASLATLSKDTNDFPKQGGSGSSRGRHKGSGCSSNVQRHPFRVSFVPIDMDTPLEEQHGGKFDVILHKMTEDILCMSKMLQSRDRLRGDLEERGDGLGVEDRQEPPAPITQPSEDANLFEATPSMTRHQARASRRIQRLREYKQRVHPSCVLVDSPSNILAVMSRFEMAEVLSRCLAGVTTKGGLPVRTPRFRVVDEESVLGVGNLQQQRPTLADEIDGSGFEYPLIAKPLTAAGTKSSHHMGIVLARDGLQRLKTPCLLQEYANHGEKLFKVYVLGDSVWVFSRESLPNLPLGEKQIYDDAVLQGAPRREGDVRSRSHHKRVRTESYVEFERPAGSRCFVEFNSQRPYPKLSDFGILSDEADRTPSADDQVAEAMSEPSHAPRSKKQRLGDNDLTLESCHHDKEYPKSVPPDRLNHDSISSILHGNSDLARFVTTDEIEPVTTALRDAFGLELFGFDVLVKHDRSSRPNENDDRRDNPKEILVVDVNYFPGYKEVPNFPSLLAQYLTQKAVESRLRNFDGL